MDGNNCTTIGTRHRHPAASPAHPPARLQASPPTSESVPQDRGLPGLIVRQVRRILRRLGGGLPFSSEFGILVRIPCRPLTVLLTVRIFAREQKNSVNHNEEIITQRRRVAEKIRKSSSATLRLCVRFVWVAGRTRAGFFLY